jgi:hypothetical protein
LIWVKFAGLGAQALILAPGFELEVRDANGRQQSFDDSLK